MNKIRIPVMAALFCALFSAHLFSAITVGEPAPDFTLTAADGETHSLSDFKGKFVVLEWTNHQCPYVKKFYKNGDMQKLQQRYVERPDNDVVWLSIVSSAEGKSGYLTPTEAMELSSEQNEHATAKLLDTKGEVGRLYGAKTTPHMFVINPEGVLIYQGAIDSIRSSKPEDIAKADNYVVAALESALKGEAVAVSESRPYGCGVKY